MQLISHQELTSAAASITFSSIPQTFTDLYVLFSTRSDGSIFADPADDLKINLNGLTTNQSRRRLGGTGSSVESNTVADGVTSSVQSTANTFGSGSIYLPNYTSSANKSASVDSVSENNATAARQQIAAYLWSQTAAVTSLQLKFDYGNLIAGSSATLYGILAGSDGIVTVS
jgi:hypothetical protein